jgi:hypothetical protein
MAPSNLAISGNDLMSELGLTPGPAMGKILKSVKELVEKNPAMNDRQILLDYAIERIDGLYPSVGSIRVGRGREHSVYRTPGRLKLVIRIGWDWTFKLVILYPRNAE